MPELNLPIWFFVKVLFIFAILVYVFFAGVVVRQVYLMTGTLKIGFETFLRAVSWLHLLLAFAVLFLALVTL